MTDEQEKLQGTYKAARKRLDGASGKSASGVEAAYGESYQALVKAGLAPQLKAKYRR